jgi:hypothetical protein
LNNYGVGVTLGFPGFVGVGITLIQGLIAGVILRLGLGSGLGVGVGVGTV